MIYSIKESVTTDINVHILASTKRMELQLPCMLLRGHRGQFACVTLQVSHTSLATSAEWLVNVARLLCYCVHSCLGNLSATSLLQED